jgi:hypothetical protein
MYPEDHMNAVGASKFMTWSLFDVLQPCLGFEPNPDNWFLGLRRAINVVECVRSMNTIFWDVFTAVINSDPTVTQLWSPISLRNTKDGGDMLSKTSILTRATRCNNPEDIYHRG